MLSKKEKAQGLVEFALILPFLLLALLGVIEAARIIWAYTTVQTAAREATRYAITGKPYVNAGYVAAPGNPDLCTKPEGQPNANTPWNCAPERRVEAIKEMAKSRLSTMALNVQCTADEILNSAPCTQKPGNYGILVIGQVISPTASFTTPLEISNHPGNQGLNVKVSIFYNVEMFDPILDAISDAMMGRPDSYIQVRGELTMQNEGVDPSLGNAPPPAIGSTNIITDTTGSPGLGPNGEQIWSVSGYSVLQNQTLTVHLENHQSQGGPYNIYLGPYLLRCPPPITALPTGTQNSGDFDCLVDVSIPAGSYDLYSTKDGQPNRLATAPQQVVVGSNNVANIVIRDPATGQPANVWTPNSSIEIQLVSHNPGTQYNIYFNYGLPSQQLIAVGIAGNASVPPWTVPNVGNLCPMGGTPCKIESRQSVSNSFVASADLFINQPQIVIEGGASKFPQGDTLYIRLTGHTPGKKYDFKISDGGSNTYYLGRTETTNSQGSTTLPVVWTVFEPGAPGWPAGWPNGFYNITSHPVADPPNMTTVNQIAIKQIEIETPSGPFITVDGGYTWPLNSTITIRVHKHSPADNPYYLNFGPFRVPVNGASPPNTFNVGSTQSAALNYLIPLGAASGPVTNHTVASYKNANNQLIAQQAITVTSVPIITVLEGNRALPDATITISLTHHVPNSIYQIIYAGTTLLESQNQPFTIQTNGNGAGQRTYNLLNLSSSNPAASTANYGTAYPLSSQQTIPPNALVATTTLAIDSADLKITQIQLPANAAINMAVPMTVTIQNTKPVTIGRYFDVDFYADPSPLVPAYQANQFTFPGDVKLWKAPIVAAFGQPGDTFKMTQPFSVTTYGKHTFYSYADTSNFIFNENNEVNNVLSNTITIGCNYPFITDSFSNLNAWATAVRYNPTDTQNQSTFPKITSGRLQMSNDGKSTAGTDDNASDRGHVFLHRTQAVNTDPGLDVWVQVRDAPKTNSYAKAGLQLRGNPADGRSAKIEFDLAWDTSNNRHRIQYSYRTAGGATGGDNTNGFINLSTSNPVWLRIKREPGSSIFSFYYAQQSAAPTTVQWTPYVTVTIDITSTLYAGLFNASYKDNTNGQAEFDDFTISNTSSCPAAQPPTTPVPPPGLTICTDPLQNKSFETLSAWVLGGNEGVVTGPGGHTGSRRLLAHSFSGGYKKPFFYQQFQVPNSLLATTTLKLNLFYILNNLDDGDDVNDKYYAIVATSPSPSSTLVTNPIEIAHGDVPPDNSSAPPKTSTGWIEKNLTLPLASGINLSSYAGQNLYLYIYDNSNTVGPGCPAPGCHASEFYFDDVNLSICTGEPEPATASTKLTGEVVLHQPGAAPQKIAGVNVWAYAENGTLYKTFTIQNGKFNFFNLPATSAGTKYFLYSEYVIYDLNATDQYQVLAANSTVLLKTSHTAQTPLVTRLDLFPLN